MKIGFGSANITPAYGMEKPGGMGKAYIQGVHDDCLVTACVLDDGEGAIAPVGVDSLSLKHSVCQAARKLIEEAVGIPGDHVMFGASHTHCGGPACDLFVTESDPEYLRHMSRQMATAVIDAYRRREELLIGIGVGEAPGVAHHRRWIMKDGSQRSHPRAEQGNMDHPQGELDPSVGVIGAGDRDGNLRGCIVNFTCHGTTGLGVGGTASADWIYFLRKSLKSVFGEDFGVVFLQGACGDVTQVDNTAPLDAVQSGPLVARRIGCTVAGEAIKELVQMELHPRVKVAGARKRIYLKPRQPTREQLKWAREHLRGDKPDKLRWATDGIWAREWLALDKLNKREKRVKCELQALTIGGAVIASNPGEFFCSLGLAIKRRSKFQPTFVVELANGCIGYVPTEDAYEGGYESQMAPSSKLVPGSGERIVEETVRLLDSMKKPRRAAF